MVVYRIYNTSKPTGTFESSFLDGDYAISVADFYHNHSGDNYKVIEYNDITDTYRVIVSL